MPTANGYWQYSSRIDMDCNDKILDMLHTKRNIITNVLYIHCTCNMCRKKNCYQLLRKDMDWNLHEKKKSHIILERHVVKYFPLHSFDQLTLIKKKDMDLLDISLCNFEHYLYFFAYIILDMSTNTHFIMIAGIELMATHCNMTQLVSTIHAVYLISWVSLPLERTEETIKNQQSVVMDNIWNKTHNTKNQQHGPHTKKQCELRCS